MMNTHTTWVSCFRVFGCILPIDGNLLCVVLKKTHMPHKIPRDEEHIVIPKDTRTFPLKVSTF